MNEQATLFNRPKTAKTQCDKLLAHFQNDGTVTSLEAYEDFKITQLGRCISDLEKDGYQFNRPWIDLPSGKRVKRYSMKRQSGLHNAKAERNVKYVR